jgi:2-(1,2-epoxy-1,2-dihydrophenyl)acetyl-CoA isomerase
LRIERPDRLNAFDRPTYRELRELVEACSADRSVRVIAITGAGRAFSAGADLKARIEDPDAGDVEANLRNWAHPMLRALRAAPQPVIAAVNGPALGIGCSLALSCDLVVAARSAYLCLPFARVGLGPDGAAALLAGHRAGGGAAARMLLLGERLPAERAHQWGLVDGVVDDDELEAEVERLAALIAAGAPDAVAAAKRALGAPVDVEFEEELEREAATQGRLARSRDHAEALVAFKEGRDPQFRGS